MRPIPLLPMPLGWALCRVVWKGRAGILGVLLGGVEGVGLERERERAVAAAGKVRERAADVVERDREEARVAVERRAARAKGTAALCAVVSDMLSVGREAHGCPRVGRVGSGSG